MSNSPVNLTLGDLQALFAFGCLVGSAAFAISSKLKEAAIDKMYAKMIQSVNNDLDKFRNEIKQDLHHFRVEQDDKIDKAEEKLFKTLSNYKVKAGEREMRLTTVERFLESRFKYQLRPQVSSDYLPSDFTPNQPLQQSEEWINFPIE
ncbi:hypothetical protein QUB05_21015 [Microcoleus sp. F10-C6]|uniref:hypothetical protein n=1 Tax=unclassified Microcoleus TaxID=2642155 RepID=UPI002FD1CA61